MNSANLSSRSGECIAHRIDLESSKPENYVTNQFVSKETSPLEILRALRALGVKQHLEDSKASENLHTDMSTYH